MEKVKAVILLIRDYPEDLNTPFESKEQSRQKRRADQMGLLQEADKERRAERQHSYGNGHAPGSSSHSTPVR